MSEPLNQDDWQAKAEALEQELAHLRVSEKEHRERKERYRAIVAAFDGLIYICSPDYRIEFINVYSEVGHGTTFTLYLPASTKKIAETEAPPQALAQGEGTILLVDDEQLILDVGVPMLEKLGYRVCLARSGREAVELLKTKKEAVDLVILDLIMPDMGGGETFERIKALKPDIKVLLSSGYSLNGQARDILKRGCSGFIQKPFSIQELSDKLNEILTPPKRG